MEIAIAFIMFFLTFISWVTFPIFWLLRIFNGKKIPQIEDDILRVSATTLADLIRKRKVSCEKVIQTYIKRIKEVNHVINAVVEDRFDLAVEEAKQVDNFLSQTSLSEEELLLKKPLLGVPLTVKESCQIKGLSASVGSLRYKGRKGDRDGDAVMKLREAGAIPLLVSNTSELCMGWETSNHITGKSNNPYKPAYSTAGSSGGEAALVASGASVVGIGSDLAGSVRLPAHFNGVFGHKPTARVVSAEGHLPYSTDEAFLNLLSIGPITRHADDLYLMMGVMAQNSTQLKLDEEVNFSNIRVYSVERIGNSISYAYVDSDIVSLIRKSVEHFRKVHCSTICSNKFKDMDKVMDMGLVILTAAAKNVDSLLINPKTGKKDLNAFSELFKSLLHVSVLSFNATFSEVLRETNGFISKSKRIYYNEKCKELKTELIKELGTNGILLLPTYYTTAFQNGQSALKPRGYMYTLGFNLMGFPATHIPMGLSKNGLPIGIQVVAAPYQDRYCLAVALELEKTFGGWVEPGLNNK